MIDDLFKKFSKQHKFVSQEMLYGMYAIVSQDIESGNRDRGVWAKAFADAKGDEQVAKAAYIELMVERLVLAKQAEEELVDQARLSQSWNETKQKVNKGIGDAVNKLDRAAHKLDEATNSSRYYYHEPPGSVRRKAAQASRKKQDFYELWWAQLVVWPALLSVIYFSIITYQNDGVSARWFFATALALGGAGSYMFIIESVWRAFAGNQEFYELWWAHFVLFSGIALASFFSYMTYTNEISVSHLFPDLSSAFGGDKSEWLFATSISFSAVATLLLVAEKTWKFLKER